MIDFKLIRCNRLHRLNLEQIRRKSKAVQIAQSIFKPALEYAINIKRLFVLVLFL